MQAKQQEIQNKPQKCKDPNKSFYQYLKKDQNLPNKNIHSNTSSGKPLPNSSNHSRNQSPYNSNYRGRSPDQRIHEIPHKTDIVDHTVEIPIIEIIIHDQIQTDRITRLIPVPIQILGIDTIQMIDQATHHTIDIEIIPTIGTEAIQIIAINNITIDHEVTQTKDQITKDPITTIIKIDHEIIHNIGIQIIKIDKETILNQLIGIRFVIQTLKTNIEVIHQNIRDK